MRTRVTTDKGGRGGSPGDDHDGPAPATEAGGRGREAVVWIAAVVAGLPALGGLVTAVGADWVPASDYAPMEVRVRDVGTSGSPVVGPYSRVGGNHPGPALFYALAVPYRAAGSQPWGLLAGAAVINALCLAASVRALAGRRRAGLALLAAGLILACAWGLEVDALRDPWNPRLAMTGFLLAACSAWAVSTGRRWWLPVAVGAASWSVQAHVGYAAVAGVVVAWCGLGLWLHRAHLRAWRAPLVATAAVAVVLWALPVAQQVAGSEGNLARVVTGARGDDAPAGWAGVRGHLLPHLGPTPAWFRASPSDPFELGGRSGLPLPPLGTLAFVAGATVAVRRRDHEAMLLAGLTAAMWAAGAASFARLDSVPAPYLYRWVRILGLMLWLSALWSLARALGPPVRAWLHRRVPARAQVRSAAVGVGAVAVVVLGAVVAWRPATTPALEPYRDHYASTAVVAERAVAEVATLSPDGVRVEVRSRGALIFVEPAVIAALERAGYPTQSAVGGGTVWGGHRLPHAAPTQRVLVLTDGDPYDVMRDDHGLAHVATVTRADDDRAVAILIGPVG